MQTSQNTGPDYPKLSVRGFFPGGKAAGKGGEVDDSPPSSAEIKNAWSYTPTPQYAFMAWCSVKAQGQLYFYLYLLSADIKL
jgi:hypothetical protein